MAWQRETVQPADGAPYFFLSYARTPRLDPSGQAEPDRWIHKLYRDLCETIYNLTNVPVGSAGFMDREMSPGTEWSRSLAEALATCRVFVPLYSPRYFESEYCGKEWAAFTRRVLEHRARDPGVAEAIVPALWVTVDQSHIPEVARTVQSAGPELGIMYAAQGFYGIMKVERYRMDYQLAVYRLARRIVEVADGTRVKAGPPVDYASLESAFGAGGTDARAPHQLRLTVVAPTVSDLPAGRGSYYYGSTPREWNPYRPEVRQPIADYAADLARCLGLQPTVGALTELDPDAAGEPDQPGLYLIDPWITRSPRHRELLRRLDELDRPWTSVLLPWNPGDTESAAAEQTLRDDLSQTLSRTFSRVPLNLQDAVNGIPTLEEFGRLLPSMANRMIGRFLKEAPVPPPDGPRKERPRLELPYAEDLR